MKVLLAGYNVDIETLNECSQAISAPLTPETLSASYARISRDPRPINELRKMSREEVQSARKSNKKIIFQMGHHSIAEHAVFNFDIMDVSRLALEAIEKFRLCSYTEKSQRYITLKDDFVVPNELKESKFKDEFISIIREQNRYYHDLNSVLVPYICDKHKELAQNATNKSLLDGWAKEDARYISSLATQGQVGLTVNARNLEFMFRRFSCSPYSEIRELGKNIYELVEKIAPSIILFVDQNAYDRDAYNDLKKYISENDDFKTLHAPKGPLQGFTGDADNVKLVSYTKDGDDVLVASILHSASSATFEEAKKTTLSLSKEKKFEIIKTALKNMAFYDSVHREWEYPELTFELVISASCYAQLKRHRMATITLQDYDPTLGITVPDSVRAVEKIYEFNKIIGATNELYYKMKNEHGLTANYILTNAHRRRVLIKTNARELYHISRLREDAHAQWDIKNISAKMSAFAKEVMPLTFSLIGGKDKYSQIYKELYGTDPRV